MNDITTPEDVTSFAMKNKISATEIPHILDYYSDKIKILSLDCFDTLLWRKTAAPVDVFYEMQHSGLHKSLGVTAYQRIKAAARAYRTKFIANKNQQVSLNEIYQFFTSLTEEQKELLVQEELKAEINLCYAFKPVVDLINQAKKLGIKVVIVSDIYLTEKQLRLLLSNHLSVDIMNSIDHIFCSIDYGKSKIDGLFSHVLEKLSELAQSILHIGDHYQADYESAKKLGLKALHFQQFDESVAKFLHMQHSTFSLSTLLQPSTDYSQKARYSPFRSVFSVNKPMPSIPETQIGYMTFGPILYAFSQFIVNEINELRQQGKKVKVFFLLRDAYLLYKACEAYAGQPVGELAYIRKFLAVAASFHSKEDVDHYLSGILPEHYNMWVIGEQLLLPRELIIEIIDIANRSSDAQKTFNEILHKEEILNLILNNSMHARARLKKYILKNMKLEAGDTLVLVDTGYIGVTQDALKRALQKELDIEIEGRYFIASHEPDRPFCKSLLTSSWCEHGIFEQSCTYRQGAVDSYDENGDPIFSEIKLSDLQYQKVQAIQSECLRFIKDARNFYIDSNINISNEVLKRTAEATLFRQIFFPTPEEIDYFKNFQHDKDMGDNLQKTIYNLDQATSSFQHYRARKSHPYELRSIDVDKSLSALMRRAFSMEFSSEEKSYSREYLRVVAISNQENSHGLLPAIPTINGYYSCQISVADKFHVGIVFGEKYQWVQVERISLLNTPHENLLNNESMVVLKDMKKNKSLFACESKNSLIMLTAPKTTTNAILTYEVIFRPTILWEA